MDLRHGSSGRMAALQAGSPEFKLQSHHKKNKQKTKEVMIHRCLFLSLLKMIAIYLLPQIPLI
jgi:hypothetical protein